MVSGRRPIRRNHLLRQFLVSAVITVWGFSSSPVWAAEPPVHDCDRWAAGPDDPSRVAEGVPFYKMDAQLAIDACTSAITVYGDVPRFLYQLGRSYQKANIYDRAAYYYEKASSLYYPIAYVALGFIYEYGQGVERDGEKRLSYTERV